MVERRHNGQFNSHLPAYSFRCTEDELRSVMLLMWIACDGKLSDYIYLFLTSDSMGPFEFAPVDVVTLPFQLRNLLRGICHGDDWILGTMSDQKTLLP